MLTLLKLASYYIEDASRLSTEDDVTWLSCISII